MVSSIQIPLIKKLLLLGDPIAKKLSADSLMLWEFHDDAPEIFYKSIETLRKNPALAKWAVQNNAPEIFYEKFKVLNDNPDLAKWAVRNNAPKNFYIYFKELSETPELAKLAVQNDAREFLYNVEKCRTCNVNMESIVKGIFQCPQCKNIVKEVIQL